MIQDNWRSCHKCQGLFFAGGAPSVCPAGGSHDGTGSTDFLLSDSQLSLPVDVTFVGGEEDDALSITSNDGGNTGIDVLSKGTSRGGQNPHGVYAETDGGGTSVSGVTEQGTGVFGDAKDGGTGVLGNSQTGRGVWGTSDSFIATVGDSTSGTGVWGRSESGNGVVALSRTANGLYAQGSPAGYFEGNITVTGDISLTGGDCAEEFDLAEDATVEAGTVMVLDPNGALCVSKVPYDKRVAGVVSGAGHLRPGIVLDRQHAGSGRTLIALTGKTYCKVDATNGPIAAGDLLTTSATPGCAMSAANPARALGAVIGKALQPWTEGRGLIPILVTLQ